MSGDWTANQANRIAFVMVDTNNVEVSGLGGGYTLAISKNGAAFAGSAGTKAEIANGWYTYLATAAEANTLGVVAVKVTGAGAVQQNLEYVVSDRADGAVSYVYTVTDSITTLPIANALVYVSTDIGGLNVVDTAYTNILGQVTFILQHGTYYFWTSAVGYTFTNPVTEAV